MADEGNRQAKRELQRCKLISLPGELDINFGPA
jgi:hypothetical protein